MNTIKGAVALVTGASSGIGEGIARMLAAEGVKVALVARRGQALERVAGDIRRLGGMALPIPADLRDERALPGIVDQTQNSLGPVDILVNSAANVYTSPIHSTDMSAWDATLAVNLRAPTQLCSLVLPGMRERKRGYIINLSSEAGSIVYAEMGAYAVSKHALRVLTELIQQENQALGIKAWAICPGYVNTPMGVDFAGSKGIVSHFLTVAEVVDVVRFLLLQGENVQIGPEILIRTTYNPLQED